MSTETLTRVDSRTQAIDTFRAHQSYPEDIPEELAKGHLSGSKHFTTFFSRVYSQMCALIQDGLIPADNPILTNFENFMEGPRDWNERPTSSDIRLVDEVVAEVIRLLELPQSSDEAIH